MASKNLTFNIFGKDVSASKAMKGVGATADSMGNKLASVNRIAGAMGLTLGGLAIAGTFAVKGFERFTAVDNANAKLTALQYTTAQTASIMDSAKQSVLGTAYGLGEAATAASAATASGVASGKQLTNYLTLIADTAAITGSSLTDISLVFNQITSAGRVYTQDANQLVARGIPVWKLLADQYGVTATEMRKMVEEGQISANTFFEVVKKKIGGSAKNIDSLEASWSNMMAAVGRTGEALAGGGLAQSKDLFEQLTDTLDDLLPVAEAVGDTVGFTVGVVRSIPVPVLAAAGAFAVLSRFKGPVVGFLRDTAFNMRHAAGQAGILRTQTALVGASFASTNRFGGALRNGLGRITSTAKTAGTALLGAVGGPAGLAITGGVALVTTALTAWTDATNRQQEAVATLTNSLDQNTGAVTNETIRLLSEQLKELAPDLEKAGISSDGLARIVAEQGPEWDALLAKLAGVSDKSVEMGHGLNLTDDAGQRNLATLTRLKGVADNLALAQSDQALQSRIAGDAIDEMGDGADSAASKLKDLADAHGEGAEAAAKADSAIASLSQALVDNGASFDQNTVAGRANAAELMSAISAMAAAAGDDSALFAANVGSLMDSLRAQGIDTSGVIGQVEGMLKGLSGTTAYVFMDGQQLVDEAARIIKSIAAINKGLSSGNTNPLQMPGLKQQKAAAEEALAEVQRLQQARNRTSTSFSTSYGNAVNSANSGGSSASSDAAAERAAKDAEKAAKTAREAFRDLGKNVSNSLAKGLLRGRQSVRDAVSSVASDMRAAFDAGAIDRDTYRKGRAELEKISKRYLKFAKDQEQLTRRIERAKERLEDAITLRNDWRTSIAESVMGLGNVASLVAKTDEQINKTWTTVENGVKTTFQKTVDQSTGGTAKDVVKGLKDKLESVVNFRKTMKKLSAMGLDDTSYQQLVEEFSQSGDSAAADSILAGGSKSVKQISSLQGRLSKEGKKLGLETGKVLFQPGVNMAQGLLKGLESEESKLYKKMKHIAKKMVKELKSELGIKSPSVKMNREVGRMLPLGIAKGIDATRSVVDRALARVVDPSQVGTVGANGATVGSASSAGASAPRPIYMEGAGLVAWLEELATGAARIVVADAAAATRTGLGTI